MLDAVYNTAIATTITIDWVDIQEGTSVEYQAESTFLHKEARAFADTSEVRVVVKGTPLLLDSNFLLGGILRIGRV
jgi:hypothetical protein